jgi:ABC-type multidrug transport system permease subunit
MERFAALWGATVALAIALGLVAAYRNPTVDHGIVGAINKYWRMMYGVLPRTYMIGMAVVCFLIAAFCLIAGVAPVPSNRPPLFK